MTQSSKPRQSQRRERQRSPVRIRNRIRIGITVTLLMMAAHVTSAIQPLKPQHRRDEGIVITSAPTPNPPSPLPTASPTALPTSKPTLKPKPIIGPIIIENAQVQNLSTTLTGVQPLTEKEKLWFQSQTKEYIEHYYNEEEKKSQKLMQNTIEEVETFIDVTNMDPPFFPTRKARRGRRALDDDKTLRITYNQVINYSTYQSEPLDLERIMTEPFNDIFKRTFYINMYLQGGRGQDPPEVFENIVAVELPEVEEEDDDKKVSIALIVGASAGGVALALVVGIICWMRSREKGVTKPEKRKAGNGETYTGNTAPTSQLNLNLSGGDEVSTLVDPPQQLGIYTNQASLNGFNRDEPSIGTFDPDPDYHGVYGGADNSIVSSVGATLSSQTQKSRFSGTHPGLFPNSGGSIYTADDQSFEQYFRNQQEVPERQEEILEVFAPAGKLGVVIDTPNNGVPMVHNIKESCPIKDQLQVGDRLIAVDDEDVRNMTAVMVSKLISLKSSNETRKFTVGRAVLVGNGTNSAIS